jgi:hypothetical protein
MIRTFYSPVFVHQLGLTGNPRTNYVDEIEMGPALRVVEGLPAACGFANQVNPETQEVRGLANGKAGTTSSHTSTVAQSPRNAQREAVT